MKKITLLVALFISAMTFAQVTLENNDGDDVVTANNSVGCPSGDNNWGRNFDLSNYTLPSDFGLLSGQIGVQSISAEVSATVNVYESSVTFDEGSLVLLGTQDVTIPASTAAPGIFEYDFDEPILIPITAEAIFVEVNVAASTFFIGGTVGNTAGTESYLKSETCSTPDYVTASSIDFPDAHFFITVTGDTVLGVNDSALAAVSIYPNPANDVINLKLPSSIELNNVSLFDALGKEVKRASNSEINIADLSAGIYVLKAETSAGTLTEKIVKN